MNEKEMKRRLANRQSKSLDINLSHNIESEFTENINNKDLSNQFNYKPRHHPNESASIRKSSSMSFMKDQGNGGQGRWTDEEHQRFIDAIKKYGKDWVKVQQYIGTRSTAQTRSHAQKYFGKLFKQGKIEDLEEFDKMLSSSRVFSDNDGTRDSKPI